jgi:hypothetical protein
VLCSHGCRSLTCRPLRTIVREHCRPRFRLRARSQASGGDQHGRTEGSRRVRRTVCVRSIESRSHSSHHSLASRRPSKFSAVRSLQIFFPANLSGGDDEETTRVYYIGLKGEWTPVCHCPSVGFLVPGSEQARGFRLRRTPMASSCMKHRRILAITRSRAWRVRKAVDWGCNVCRISARCTWFDLYVRINVCLLIPSINEWIEDGLFGDGGTLQMD